MAKPTAVVTGASSGIGAATVWRLVAEGYNVLAAARRRAELEALTSSCGCRTIGCDVTDVESVRELARQAVDCELLVHCAGESLQIETFANTDPEKWRRIFDLNVLGALRVTQALLPQLTQSRHAQVVVVSSIVGNEIHRGGREHAAARHTEASFVEPLRIELLGTGICVTEIALGVARKQRRLVGTDSSTHAEEFAYVDRLIAEDVADCITWAVTRPTGINIDLIRVAPTGPV